MPVDPILLAIEPQRGGEHHVTMRQSNGRVVQLVLPDGQLELIDVWGLDRALTGRLALADRAADQLSSPPAGEQAGVK